MAKIDERIVSMEFDNKNFEKGARESISTLDKLKTALQLKGGTKGLEDVDKAAQNHKLGKIGEALDEIKSKFSATSIIAITALANIANKAVNVGMNMAKALTIEPVLTGFQEYETQMNAVQTILANTASKGTTLRDVSGALNELNRYADLTIYNFTEMTRNIGTFTAAGLDLDTSTRAIKGIANLAAVSGSNSQQASMAMYQLSQALASGTVKLMDWNSVVNAGMGGQVFQDALKETARVHGIAIDDIIKKQGSFRESLSEGWLSSEILTETLDKFTGDLDAATLKQKGYTDAQIAEIQKLGQTANDAATKVKTFTQLVDTLKEAAQSGWTQSWELILGDFEEAKALWTAISDEVSGILNDTADARNKMLKEWKNLGGRTKLLDGLAAGWKSIKLVVGEVAKAFRDVFPATTGKQLAAFTQKFSIFMNDLYGKLVAFDVAEKLHRTFKGLFSIFKIGISVVKGVINVFTSLLGAILPVGGDFLSVTATIGDFFTSIAEGIDKSKGIETFFDGVAKAVSEFASVLTRVVGVVGNLFDGMSSNINFDNITNGVKSASDIIGKAGDIIKAGVDKIKAAFSSLSDAFKKADVVNAGTSGMSFISSLVSSGALAAFTVLLTRLSNVVKGFKLDNIINALSGSNSIVGNLKSLLGESKNALNEFTKSLQIESLRNIAISIGILAASLAVLSLIKPEKLAASMAAITGLFIELGIATKVFLSTFDSASMSGSAKAIGFMTTLAASILALSVSLVIMAAALKLMASINLKEMGTALLGLAGTMGILSASVKILDKAGNIRKTASSILALSVSLVIMAAALKLMASINLKEMGTALLGLAGSMAIMVAGMSILSRLNFESKIPSLISFAAALTIMAAALKLLSTINLKEMGVALLGVAGSMAILVAGLAIMSALNVEKTSASLIAAASAMVILGAALKIMSSMSLTEIGKGLVALAGSMAILAVGLTFMSGTIGGAAALLVAAAAINVLVPALVLLGNMEMSTIGKALLGLAAALAIFAIAGMALSAAVPGLAAFAAVMLAIGVAATGIGLALTAVGVALAALAAGGQAAIAVIIYAVKELILLIPEIGAALAMMFVTMMTTINENSIPLIESFTALLSAMLDAVILLTPKFAETLTVLINAGLGVIIATVPQFVQAGITIIVSFLRGVANNMGRIINEGARVIVTFLRGIGSKAALIIDEGIKTIIKFMNGLARGIATHSAEINAAGIRIIKAIAQGMMNGVGQAGSIALSAARNLASKALEGIKSFLGIHSPSRVAAELGGYFVEGFANGIEDTGGMAVDAIEENMSEMLSILEEYEKEFEGVFDNVDMAPTITPVLDLSEFNVATANLNDIFNPARGISLAANVNAAESGTSKSSANQSDKQNITFNQYNNSPRALDRIEIYRQTRTQLATLQRV